MRLGKSCRMVNGASELWDGTGNCRMGQETSVQGRTLGCDASCGMCLRTGELETDELRNGTRELWMVLVKCRALGRGLGIVKWPTWDISLLELWAGSCGKSDNTST